MFLSLNPDLLLSSDCAIGVSRRDGRIHTFSSSEQRRLREVRALGKSLLASQADMPLVRTSVLVPATSVELSIDSMRAAVRNQWDSSGLLIVMPTERCNFRCSYCYETFARAGMKPAIIEGVVGYLAKAVPLRRSFDLAWFGGEPLLQLRTLLHVSDHFRRIQRDGDVSGTISITTNGYGLTSDTVEKLQRVGIDVYQITLDGPDSIHDRQRKHINGNATYDRIMANVVNLLAQDEHCRVVIRVNIDTSSSDAAVEVQAWLRNEIHPLLDAFPGRCEVHIVPIWDADTNQIDGICLTEVARYQVWAGVLREALRASDLQQYLAAAVSTLGGLACYAGKPNSYVVGADGAVYKCTVALDLPDNQVGTLLPSGEIVLDTIREALWTGNNALTDATCGGCAFAQSCQGLFCPLLRLQTAKQPCPTEKRFASELLQSVEVGINVSY